MKSTLDFKKTFINIIIAIVMFALCDGLAYITSQSLLGLYSFICGVCYLATCNEVHKRSGNISN